jgi:hypothetical protein
MSMIQRMHDKWELGGEIEWRADGLIEVNLGHFKGAPYLTDIGSVTNGAAAMRWLQDATMRDLGVKRTEVRTTAAADVKLLDELRTSREARLSFMDVRPGLLRGSGRRNDQRRQLG